MHDVDGTRISCAGFEFRKSGSLSEDPGNARPIDDVAGTNGTVTDGGDRRSRTSAVPLVTIVGAAGPMGESCSGRVDERFMLGLK